MQKITLKTIAQKVKVSPSTVSRVIRNDRTCYISKSKKQAILEAVRKLNYAPNFAARNLALGKSSNVAFVLCRLCHIGESGPFTFKILENIQETLRREGYSLSVITIPHDNLNGFREICLSRKLYDGIIFGSGVISEETADIIKNSEIPKIVVDDNSPFLENIPRVITDKEEGITSAISYLKKMGHRKIAFYGHSTSMLELFRKAMINNELSFDKKLDFRFSSGNIYELMFDAYVNATLVLENLSKFTGVFCANDFVALGLIQRLTEKKIKVGSEISIIGFDNIEELLNVPEDERFLTTIHKPREKMGEETAELLLKMMKNGRMRNRAKKLPCRLIIRKSTGYCKGGDEK